MLGLKFLAIMRRDLKKLTRNPITLISTILMPIVYLVIIGNSFQGQLKHLPVIIVQQDRGIYARRIVEQMLALQAGPKTVDVTFESNVGAAIDDVRDGRYKGVVVIPPGFSHAVAEGRIAQIGLFTDNVDAISSGTLEAVLAQAAATVHVSFVTAREPKLSAISLRPSWLFPYVDYDRSLIPGVIVMAIFMGSLMSGVFNWVMDKFLGVTECYLVTPLSRWDIAGGVLASGVTVTSVAGTFVLFLGLLITRGRVEGGLTALLMLIGIIIISSTGLLAMTFSLPGCAGHPRLVGTFAGFLNVILFFPSGAIYPVESFPPWLRSFAHYNPETHSVSAIKSILFKGADFAAVRGDVTFLLIFMAIMLVLASVSFKRTL
ncbi:MAG: ABC transporter permease [Candidatus Binatus sp.]|uniref:ABC transporter permease n=1 Tax=Candidatus Binatus sp. TaxID=2811406 RepID=UPI002717123A|nr:ABC transporter permease [Candidatus Binatus sp.]MDO8432755.1 ABC transporter permease [Candidatus Binatus sp.]